jgi:hypothetical protein
MILLNPALLAGLALVAVPVILHLMMRAKPKRLVFPALRLIQMRRKQSTQRLRLRHLLLLLLRMGVIAAFVILIARPSVPAADYLFTLGDWVRLGVVTALLAAAYFGVLAWWQKQKQPAHQLAWRRTWLRFGVGVAAVLLGLGVVAWPYASRVAASIDSPTIRADQTLPVSAILLFDTSLGMEYQLAGRSRLDVAREIAIEHLKSLPAGSRVALVETGSNAPPRFQSDLAAMQGRITGLATSAVAASWIDRLGTAFDLHRTDRERPGTGAAVEALREIYVLTDLSAGGLPANLPDPVRKALDEQKDVGVYILDVAVPNPLNVGIVDVTLADQAITAGGDLAVTAKVRGWGATAAGPVTLELLVADDNGQMVKQGQAEAVLEPGAEMPVAFRASGLTGTFRQGEVRLVGSDPLLFDNSRGFSVEIRPPAKVLVVAETRAKAQFLMEALAPAELVALRKAKYQCVFATPKTWLAKPLKEYAAVCLLNLPDPAAEGWKALGEFVNGGGGVFIALGGRVSHSAYLSPAAREVLPGELKAALTFKPPEFLDLADLTHPILKKFADWGPAGLTGSEVKRYWLVAPTADATVVCRFTDARQAPPPALLTRSVGEGRVVLLTTGFDRDDWFDLPSSGWPYVALSDQILRFTARIGDVRWNYQAGEDVLIPLEVNPPPRQLLLRKPGNQQVRVDVAADAKRVMLRELNAPGNYGILGAELQSTFTAGLSMAAPSAESDVSRVKPEQLLSWFGNERVRVATTIEGLKREVRAGRIGREAFPPLATLLVVLFLLEHVIANYFYAAERGAVESPQAG